MRKWIWAAIGLLGLLVGLGVVLIRPMIRRVAVELAEREGLVLRFSDLELGASSVTLRDVRLTPKLSGFMDARLDRVQLGLSWTAPRLRSVWVDGGRVVLRGSMQEVQEGYRALRRTRQRRASSGGDGVGRFVRVQNMKVLWHDAFEPGVLQELTGVQLERGPGGERVGADLVQLRVGQARLELAGLVLGFGAGGAVIESLSASEARVSYELRASAAEPAKEQSPDPKVQVGAKGADSKARSEPDGPGLVNRFRLDPALPKRIAVALVALRKEALPRLPESASVDRLWVTIRRGLEHLEVGPGRLAATKKEGKLALSFEPGKDAAGTPLAVELTVPLTEGNIAGSVSGGPITLRALGLDEGSFGLRGVHSTELTGKLRGTLETDAIELDGKLELDRLQIQDPRIATETLLFPRLSLGGGLRMNLDGSEFAIQDGEIGLGEARLVSSLRFERAEKTARLAMKLNIPPLACGTLLASAPDGLLGLIEETRMSGTFALELRVNVDTEKLSDMDVTFQLANQCRIDGVPGPLAPEQFARPFTRTVPGSEDLPMLVESGPGSASWTPYEQISPYFETALLVTEDGRFFHHHGFDPRAIESSIRDNVTQGRFVRGASTLSMQLAKNLYLSREKVLARKLKEALLTTVLEQHFEKRKLLELYMNVVELGPGVYGVKQAAHYYFNTTPDRLTTAQCFFLASILPSPKKQHFESDGRISSGRRAYLERLMRIANERERLSSTELTRALAEELILGSPETGLGATDSLPVSSPGAPATAPSARPLLEAAP